MNRVFLRLERIKQNINYLELVEGKDGEKIIDFVGVLKGYKDCIGIYSGKKGSMKRVAAGLWIR